MYHLCVKVPYGAFLLCADVGGCYGKLAQDRPAQILEIYRDDLKPEAVPANRKLEKRVEHLCRTLGFRDPYLTIESVSGSQPMSTGTIIIIFIAACGVLMMRFRKRWLAKINIARFSSSNLRRFSALKTIWRRGGIRTPDRAFDPITV